MTTHGNIRIAALFLVTGGLLVFTPDIAHAQNNANSDPLVTDSPAGDFSGDQGDPADDPMQDRLLGVNIQEAFAQRMRMSKPAVTPADVGSILYTPWQHALLQEAKRGFLTRQVDNPADLEKDPDAPRKKGPREVAVGGIVYAAPMEWTVWLNGQRIAPDALPEEVIDIKVSNDYIDLKWYDSYTNLIYPIRLRAHQRFNLDSRIFLPGAGKL